MRRHRRLLVINRLIPVLAAGVALAALAALVASQTLLRQDQSSLGAQLGELQKSLAAIVETRPSAAAADNGTSTAALAALAARLDQLEARLEQQALAPAGAVSAPATEATADGESGQARGADAADGPTTDCIPLGTRFVVTPGETYPMCRSKVVVKVGDISGDTVDIGGAGPVVETGFGNLPGTKCTVMVFSADIEGFGELRVTCS